MFGFSHHFFFSKEERMNEFIGMVKCEILIHIYFERSMLVCVYLHANGLQFDEYLCIKPLFDGFLEFEIGNIYIDVCDFDGDYKLQSDTEQGSHGSLSLPLVERCIEPLTWFIYVKNSESPHEGLNGHQRRHHFKFKKV